VRVERAVGFAGTAPPQGRPCCIGRRILEHVRRFSRIQPVFRAYSLHQMACRYLHIVVPFAFSWIELYAYKEPGTPSGAPSRRSSLPDLAHVLCLSDVTVRYRIDAISRSMASCPGICRLGGHLQVAPDHEGSWKASQRRAG
jgi:hypothetical protein